MSEEPEKPDQSECCGSGCNPCILDVYEHKLKKWKLNQQNVKEESKALNQSKYLPFLVKSINSINRNTNIYEFQAVSLKLNKDKKVCVDDAICGIDYDILTEPLRLKMGDFLILKGVYRHCELTENISRSYTPVSDHSDFATGIFKTIVRLYPRGKMAQFLTNLKVSDIVFWRGPYNEFIYSANTFRNILLFGGGTGVVPIYNIAKSIVEDEQEETRVKVITSFRTLNDILLRREFGKLRDYWNFQMDVYISEELEANFALNYGESVISGRIDDSVIRKNLENCNAQEVFVVICGPTEFNKAINDIVIRCNVDNKNIFVFL